MPNECAQLEQTVAQHTRDISKNNTDIAVLNQKVETIMKSVDRIEQQVSIVIIKKIDDLNTKLDQNFVTHSQLSDKLSVADAKDSPIRSVFWKIAEVVITTLVIAILGLILISTAK